ncbi:MAG: YHS domain-containing (seleno)protein [Pseudomonadota bacterium]
MIRHILGSAALALAVVAAAPSEGQARDPIYQTLLGTAIDGTDPISYFTEGRPIEGSSDFSAEWNGAIWYFASAENRERFLAKPEQYAPQYGGYCAWAIAQGSLASTDPDNWDIVDGKLYLNYNDSIQERWRQDIPGFIAEADDKWPEILD